MRLMADGVVVKLLLRVHTLSNEGMDISNFGKLIYSLIHAVYLLRGCSLCLYLIQAEKIWKSRYIDATQLGLVIQSPRLVHSNEAAVQTSSVHTAISSQGAVRSSTIILI